MPSPNDAFSTLDDFLLSLADGIGQAQAELARAGVQGPPGRQHSYHLPRVDFELKMNLRVVDDPRLSDRYKQQRVYRLSNKHLLFAPAKAGATESSEMEIAAVVRGTFVAVPANDGLPSAVLRTSIDDTDPKAPQIVLVAQNAAGEPLAGLEVQFSLDREESALLTTASGGTFTLDPETRLDRGVAYTDADGTTRVTLHVAAAQRGTLVLVVDAAGRTETVVYEVTA